MVEINTSLFASQVLWTLVLVGSVVARYGSAEETTGGEITDVTASSFWSQETSEPWQDRRQVHLTTWQPPLHNKPQGEGHPPEDLVQRHHLDHQQTPRAGSVGKHSRDLTRYKQQYDEDDDDNDDDDADKEETEEYRIHDKSYDYDANDSTTWKDRMQSDFVGAGKGSAGGGTGARNSGKRRKSMRKKGGDVDKSSDSNYMVGYSHEYRIKEKLLVQNYYDKTTRPVREDDSRTTLYVGMSLYHILDTNEKYQTLSALIAIRLRWMDEYMRWNISEYGGLQQIWVPAMHLWTPDIFINNFADDSFQDFMNTYAIVTHTGEVLWMFPAVVKTYCTLDVRHFPFDRQKCNIVFISWTFNGFKLNLTYNEHENQTVYYTPKNQEWYVDQVSVDRNEKIYACCIEPYPDVTFTIHMTRRSLFYIINLIFPCLLIYAVAFLGFFLPVESGEKVNLEITILLALVVFLLIVGETLPPTPDAIPALGLLFGLTMIMVSIALVMAVVVTNIYLRKDQGKRVPQCLRTLFLRSAPLRHAYTDKVNNVTENHVNDVKHNDMELDNLSMLSEFENLTCKTRHCSSGANANRRHSVANSFNRSHYRRDTVAEDVCETYLHEKYSQEWRSLAKNVDRFFFWLFLVASIGALVSMFSTVPQMNAT